MMKSSWGPLVSVHENTLVMDAVKLMKDHGYKNLPVFRYQRALNHQPELEYTGILSVQDVSDYLVCQNIFNELEHPQEFDSDSGFRTYLRQVEEKLAVQKTRVGQILGRVKESAENINECSVPLSESIYTLLDRFIKGDHRVIVRDPLEKLKVDMLTQTDLMRFLLSKDRSMFSSKAYDAAERAMKSRGPSDLSADPNQPANAKKHVLTIQEDRTALNAFKMMNTHRISSLGIADSQKKIVGVLSASDILCINWNRLEDLLLPIKDFKELGMVVTANSDSALVSVVEKALKNSVHGIFIADQEMHPIGIIKFSDIFAMILV